MQLPSNGFKKALKERRVQIGLWKGLPDAYTSELLASTGFDWLGIDAEHSPNDPRTVLAQLQALAAYPIHALVRVVSDDVAVIKQYLDIGVQTLLVPMVETAEQAARVVAATRYPPQGIRGVGTALARAARWNQADGYLEHNHEQLCVLVQVESVRGLENLRAICEVDGIDGVFFGPADLAASMGMIGRSTDAAVQSAIDAGIKTICAAGKAAGILTTDRQLVLKHLQLGATFVAIGVDTLLLSSAAKDLADSIKRRPSAG